MQEDLSRNKYLSIINEQTIVYQTPMIFKQGD